MNIHISTISRSNYLQATITITRDPVFRALLAILALLALLDPTQVSSSLTFTLESLYAMLPFFLLAIAIAAFAKATAADT